jgi:hypothetical protein
MCLPFPDEAERTLSKGEHAGFQFQTVYNGSGYRCGYVRVEPGHPWFGKHYDHIEAEVHGGLTFADPGKPCPTHGAEAEWWVGFDCAHGGDAPDPIFACKFRENFMRSVLEGPLGYGTVRDQEYVDAECRSLCEQAAKA